jgi:hypothetical protein
LHLGPLRNRDKMLDFEADVPGSSARMGGTLHTTAGVVRDRAGVSELISSPLYINFPEE